MSSGLLAGQTSGTPIALLLASLAVVTGLGLDPWNGGALLLLVFGAGYPWLMRWTPVEPSPLKVVLYSALLSVPLVGIALFLFELFLDTPDAWRATWWFVALSQVLCVGRTLRFDPLGKAAWVSLILGALLTGLGVTYLFGGGNGPRLVAEGSLFQAGIAQAMERGLPWENPWLAGAPLPVTPVHAFLVRVVSGALDLTPTTAQAALSCAAIPVVCIALYLIAAPLYRESRRVVLAAPLAILSVNSMGGWIRDTASGTAAPGSGLAAFLDPGPTAMGMAYAVAALSAAAHGLRHGARPWLGLTVLLSVLAMALQFWVGLVVALAVVIVALVHPGSPGVRSRMFVAMAAASLPLLYLLRSFGPAWCPGSPTVSSPLESLVLAGAFQAVLALGLLGGRWLEEGGEGDERGRSTILCLLLATSATGSLLVGLGGEGGLGPIHLTSFSLGLLAAGGVVDGLGGTAGRRLSVSVAGLALLGGASRNLAWASAARAASMEVVHPVLTQGRFLTPEFVDESETSGTGILPQSVLPSAREVRDAAEVRRRHLALAYGWLREEASRGHGRPLLVRAPAEHDPARVDPDPSALYADLALWVDREALAFGSTRWSIRHERTSRLYRDPQYFEPAFMKEFEAIGRPVYFLVEELDREKTHPRGEWRPYRGIDTRLERHGAERVYTQGTVAVYRWQPSGEEGE